MKITNMDRALFFCSVVILILAFIRIHLRVQTTVIGYRIGALKNSETNLLELRSSLQMKTAMMTAKKNLTKMVEQDYP